MQTIADLLFFLLSLSCTLSDVIDSLGLLKWDSYFLNLLSCIAISETLCINHLTRDAVYGLQCDSSFQCGNMAREGLRVLVVAKKSLTEEQYQDFEVSFLFFFFSVSFSFFKQIMAEVTLADLS